MNYQVKPAEVFALIFGLATVAALVDAVQGHTIDMIVLFVIAVIAVYGIYRDTH